MKQPSVSVVIPSWNSVHQLQTNLPSVLSAAKTVGAEVIIVDDHSQLDHSQAYLKSLGDKIHYYPNHLNQGYSFSVNRGVELATGEIVILLNTDVEVDGDCFTKALAYFADPNVFSIGFNSGEGSMRITWERGLFHHFKQEYDPSIHRSPIKSVWSSGGQGAFNRQKWLELGGMDLLYKPYYWEDTDLGYRAWKRGWTNLFAPDCHCIHHHDQSVIASNFTQASIYTVAQRNQFLFIWKNITDLPLLLTHFIWLPFYLSRYPKTILQSLRLLPQVLRGRRRERRYWKRTDRDILKTWTKS